MEFSERVKSLPKRPGVYIMKDAQGVVLYVGKAKNLNARVRNYLRPGADGRVHIKFLMDKVTGLDWVVTGSEKEALILENTIIKKHRPRYNIDLKDDKTYLSLRIDLNEDFPRLDLVRRVKRDGAEYLGPYSSARDLRATVEILLKIFPLRSCSDNDFKSRTRPCLYHWTRGCPAPCRGLITKEGYHKLVDQIALFLKGRNSELIETLETNMAKAAQDERFELAALLRDRLLAIKATLEKQKTVTHSPVDRDAISWVREGAEIQAAVLVVRGGAIIDQRSYHLPNVLEDDEDFAAEFLRSYYREDRIIPGEIIVKAISEEGRTLLEPWLLERRGKKVNITSPQRGDKAALLKMAEENAGSKLAERRKSKIGFEAAMKELGARLGMERPPRKMECFDVSNFQGTEAVVGMVTFVDGMPDKGGYRRFRIKTIEGSDDFGMLHEAITRRLLRRDQPGWEVPDLMVIDGGRGQLSSALKAIEETGASIPMVVGLAKARTLKETRAITVDDPLGAYPGAYPGESGEPDVLAQRGAPANAGSEETSSANSEVDTPAGHSEFSADTEVQYQAKGTEGSVPPEPESTPKSPERVFLPGRLNPLILPKNSSALFLMQRIRDEAHRYSITFHRKTRSKSALTSELDAIPGLGPKRVKTLLKHFGSVKALKAASLEEVKAVPSLPESIAAIIFETLSKT